MGKKNKKKKLQHRQKQLAYIKSLYEKQKSDKEIIAKPVLNNNGKPKSTTDAFVMKTNYINRDLINLIVLTSVLILISVAMYFYDQKTDFLGNLANNLLKGIIK